MNIHTLLRTTSLALITLCSFMATPLTCDARQVVVDWGVASLGSEESGDSATSTQNAITTRADALNQAIVRGTLEEAFALLPKKMPDKQKAALKKYLSAKAQNLVRSYREESNIQLPTGQYRLTMDIDVDKQWLVKALQGLGVYYTAKQAEPVACTLYYVGQSDADKKSSEYKKASSYMTLLSTAAGLRAELGFVTEAELAAMDRAAGISDENMPDENIPDENGQVDPITEALNAAKMGAGSSAYVAQGNPQAQAYNQVQNHHQAQAAPQEPKKLESLRFLLIPQGKDAWAAKLQGPDYDVASKGNTIDAVWQNLWPAYLSKHIVVAEQSASSAVSLQVWGWSSADGAVVFDKAIRDWYKDRGLDDKNLDLLKIIMQAGSVKAVWHVDMADSSKLKAFVSEYTSQRRLRFDLAPLAQGMNAKQ